MSVLIIQSADHKLPHIPPDGWNPQPLLRGESRYVISLALPGRPSQQIPKLPAERRRSFAYFRKLADSSAGTTLNSNPMLGRGCQCQFPRRPKSG